INEKGGRAWVYYFDRQRSGPGGQELGAYHGAELPYVFDRHDSWLTTAAEDRALTVTMMDYWVQFARDGDPNIREHPAWPVYTGKEPVVMALGDRVRPVRDPSIELCEMLGPGSWQQEKEQ
ncbi:carboxylesterase family protein, partial [Pseudomonadota bacterium]